MSGRRLYRRLWVTRDRHVWCRGCGRWFERGEYAWALGTGRYRYGGAVCEDCWRLVGVDDGQTGWRVKG